MWRFVSDSDDIIGPYSPTQTRFRMSGGLGGWGTCYSFGALGAWVPPGPYGGPLISQYITPRGGSAGRYDVWMLPMRMPITAQTANGTPYLRLGYWKGNDALLGPAVVPPINATSGAVNCASNTNEYVTSLLPPSTSSFANSRTLMGCTDPPSKGVGALHQCPLESVACHFMLTCGFTFR